METLDYLKPSLHRRQKRRDKRLHEEVIECYRRGSRVTKGRAKEVNLNNFDNLRWHEGMKRMHHGGTKYFNDNLEPLIRFLHAKVGQNWDKVYSELCRTMDKSTVSGLHVFNHLWDYVEIKAWKENGFWFSNWQGKKVLLYSTPRWSNFYVHPKNHVLMRAPDYKRIAKYKHLLKDYL